MKSTSFLMVTSQAKISREELRVLAGELFGNFVKAVVDVEQKVMVVQAELHADEEFFLLDRGSKQKNLWGINLYPELEGESFIEFDSMINLRPSQGNASRFVEDEKMRTKITKIVQELIQV